MLAWLGGPDFLARPTDGAGKIRVQTRAYSTDQLKPERSLAPGPSVAAAEIRGVSAEPSQTFSALLSRTGEYRLRQSREEEHA